LDVTTKIPIIKWILQYHRQYVIEDIKAPMLDAIVALSGETGFFRKLRLIFAIIKLIKRFPEPTKENCVFPNSRRLIEIRDKFFELEGEASRVPIYRAIWKLLIVEYEHDGDKRHRIDWILEQIQQGKWETRAKGCPTRTYHHWNEYPF